MMPPRPGPPADQVSKGPYETTGGPDDIGSASRLTLILLDGVKRLYAAAERRLRLEHGHREMPMTLHLVQSHLTGRPVLSARRGGDGIPPVRRAADRKSRLRFLRSTSWPSNTRSTPGATAASPWVPSYTLDEAIRRLARIGYDGIEIGCAAPHAWPAHLRTARRRELRDLMAGEGLPCVSLLPAPGGGPGNNPASPVAEERDAAIAHYKEVVDRAVDLGADRVLYIAGWRVFGTGQAQAWDWSLAALRAIAGHAAAKGVTICIEPTSVDSNLIDTAGHALQLREQSGGSNVAVMFDTYHALYRNEVSSDYVHDMAAHLKHVHFADTDRLPPGEGACDWRGVMQALKDVGFDGHVTMEIGFNTRAADPEAELATL